MTNVELVKQIMSLIEEGQYDIAEELLSDDFTFSGPVPEPISGQEWLGLHKRLQEAMPDFSFNMSDVEERPGKVRTTIQITGTHPCKKP